MLHNVVERRKNKTEEFSVGGEEGGHQKCGVKTDTDKIPNKIFCKRDAVSRCDKRLVSATREFES
jgi:hypothetical protein